MNDPSSMLPLMLLGDGDLDFTTLFLLSNTMQQDCVHSTDDQMMMYMPLLLGGVSSNHSFLRPNNAKFRKLFLYNFLG